MHEFSQSRTQSERSQKLVRSVETRPRSSRKFAEFRLATVDSDFHVSLRRALLRAQRRNRSTPNSSQQLLPRRRTEQVSYHNILKIWGSGGAGESTRRRRDDTSCEQSSSTVLRAKNIVSHDKWPKEK
jgi:hypothetical protein